MTAVDPDPLPVDDDDVDPDLVRILAERAEQGLPPTIEIEVWY